VKDAASQGQPVIEAKGVNLVFQTADGSSQAVADVRQTVDQGASAEFIGPAGAAETIFLRGIAAWGQARPTSPDVTRRWRHSRSN